MEDGITIFVFGLQVASQTAVAYKTEKLGNLRRLFDTVVRIARKEGKACRAHFTKTIVTSEAFYAGPHHENDESFMLYQKCQKQVLRVAQK